MTEQELKDLASTIGDLKKAVRKNDPLLRAMMSSQGWIPFTLVAGLGIALFCLPAQILVAAYGGFSAIPEVYRTCLWAFLALIVVLASAGKMALLSRKAARVEEEAGLGDILKVFFAGANFHIGVPYVLILAAGSAFAIHVGHPWYIAPVIAIPTCFWSNFMAGLVDSPIFKAAGWWCLLTGLASLFFIEAAPFIWLFVIFGGLCLVFAGAMILVARQERNGGR